MSAEQWARDIDVNLTGAFRVVAGLPPRDARARLRADRRDLQRRGASSGLPGQVAYAASKAGLLGMVKTVAAENVRRGITANAVLPGHGRDREGAGDAGRDPRAAERCDPVGPHGRAGRGRRRWSPTSPRRRPATSPARRSGSTAAAPLNTFSLDPCASADRVPGTSDLELARDVLAQAADRLRKRLVQLAAPDRRGQRRGCLARVVGRASSLRAVNSSRSCRDGSSPARSSRATTAQRLASTSTWNRRSRGTHSRTSE